MRVEHVLQLGPLSLMPYAAQLLLEYGLLRTLCMLVLQLVSGSLAFAVFRQQVRTAGGEGEGGGGWVGGQCTWASAVRRMGAHWEAGSRWCAGVRGRVALLVAAGAQTARQSACMHAGSSSGRGTHLAQSMAPHPLLCRVWVVWCTVHMHTIQHCPLPRNLPLPRDLPCAYNNRRRPTTSRTTSPTEARSTSPQVRVAPSRVRPAHKTQGAATSLPTCACGRPLVPVFPPLGGPHPLPAPHAAPLVHASCLLPLLHRLNPQSPPTHTTPLRPPV